MPPFESRSLGLLLVSAGVVAVIVGLVVLRGGLGWLGNLPGDIRIERAGTRVYIPLVSMLLVSIVLSGLSYVVRRFL